MDHGVVVGSESRPVPLLDKADGGKAFADSGRRAVFRRIVEDDDLDLGRTQRLEAGEEKLAGVCVDERD